MGQSLGNMVAGRYQNFDNSCDHISWNHLSLNGCECGEEAIHSWHTRPPFVTFTVHRQVNIAETPKMANRVL